MTDSSLSDWHKITKLYPEANFLQSPSWSKTNELLSKKTLIKSFDEKNYALMIVQDAKRGRYLEIPCGPLIDWQDTKNVQQVFNKILDIAHQEHCVFVRFRPQLIKTPENLAKLAKIGAKPAPMHLAAEHTVIIDLTKSEEELLSNMRRQTRYEVRRADKQGIVVDKSTSEETFREFHKVQLATAKRQNFVPPSLKTLLAEHAAFGDNAIIYTTIVKKDFSGHGVLAARLHGGEPPLPRQQPAEWSRESTFLPIAYGLILIDGNEAAYYEAASTELGRKLPGAYALLWQAMKDLKKQRIKRFNLWGIAPPNQPNHRYAGVTTFKTGFGGEIIEYVPAHDIILSSAKYLVNKIVETSRKKKRHL